MEQVISDLDLDMTAEQLKESVSINNPTDTRILEILSIIQILKWPRRL